MRPVPNVFPAVDPGTIRLALIGESPGADEVAVGLPFAGKSGWWLNQWLAQAGLSRYSCFVGNVCVEETTPILMADLTWKPINKVNIGDQLLAFDEFGKTRGQPSDWRKWRVSTVLAVKHSLRECLRLDSEQGSIVMTPDHHFLASHKKDQVGDWTYAGRAQLNRTCLSYLFKPEQSDFAIYDRAYLAGLFDGEGSLTVSSALKRKRSLSVSFAQTDNNVLREGIAAIHRLGFQTQVCGVNRKNPRHKICYRVRIRGGVKETLRFLAIVRPVRILPKLVRYLEDPPVFRVKPSVITAKTPTGLQRVVDIQTTTKTFIAAGFAVHNCQMRPSPTSNEFDLLEWNGAEVQAGIAALQRDLEAFKPNCVVALGNAAFHLLRHGNTAPPKSQKLKLFQYPSRIGTWRGSLFEGARSFDMFEAADLRVRAGRRAQLFSAFGVGGVEVDTQGNGVKIPKASTGPTLVLPILNRTGSCVLNSPSRESGASPDSIPFTKAPPHPHAAPQHPATCAGDAPLLLDPERAAREGAPPIASKELPLPALEDGLSATMANREAGTAAIPLSLSLDTLGRGDRVLGSGVTPTELLASPAPLPLSWKCLCTYHPALTFRDPSATYPLVSDLKRAVLEAASPTLTLPRRDIVWNLSAAEVEARCEAIRQKRTPVGFDIEGGLGGLQCLSFATSPHEAFVVDLMERNFDYARKMVAIASVLEDPHVPKVCWNAAYERVILQAVASITLRGYEDGMLAWWERFSELPKALDFVASVLTREPYWAEGIGWDKKTGAPKVTGPAFYLYNGIDSCVTLEIWEHPLVRTAAESRTPVKFAL